MTFGRKMEKLYNSAPWKYTLSHFPYSAIVSDEEPNCSHPPTTIFSRYALCKFWLFPRLKFGPKGHHIAFIRQIQHTATTRLMAMPEEDLQKCFWQCQDHCRKCVCAEGQSSRMTRLGFIHILFSINYAWVMGHFMLPCICASFEATLNFW
jgi:hypothetical protein